jgi:hypothetical protein
MGRARGHAAAAHLPVAAPRSPLLPPCRRRRVTAEGEGGARGPIPPRPCAPADDLHRARDRLRPPPPRRHQALFPPAYPTRGGARGSVDCWYSTIFFMMELHRHTIISRVNCNLPKLKFSVINA